MFCFCCYYVINTNRKIFKGGKGDFFMKTEMTLMVFGVLIFILGFLSANIVNSLADYYDVEVPFLDGLNVFNNLNEKAPRDYISEDQIFVYEDKVVIFVDDVSLSKYSPTGSMRPVLDEGSNGLRVSVESVDDIDVGDIVSFKKDNILIVHRIIEKGVDNEGVYFITKGDNNPIDDGKIRLEQINYKTIGVIW